MICVGINVAKDKHDCFIMNSDGEVLADVFTVPIRLPKYCKQKAQRTTKARAFFGAYLLCLLGLFCF